MSTDPCERAKAWLSQHLPRTYAALNPGATDARLDELEAWVGTPLPEDFRALYRQHDGESDKVGGIVMGLRLMPLADIEFFYSIWMRSIETLARMGEEFDNIRSLEPTKVKGDYFHPHWIPFAHDGGNNFLAFDCAPEPEGTYGQIIVFGRDDVEKYVVASSWDEFIVWVFGVLERGYALVEVFNEGVWSVDFLDRQGNSSHPFDMRKPGNA